MARYIDADALAEKKFQKPECKGFGEGVAYRCGWNDAIDAIMDNEPSADVQPVRHGHWIIKDNPGTGWYRVICSECGEDVTSVAPVIGFFPNARVTWDFCPECGARMDGEQ